MNYIFKLFFIFICIFKYGFTFGQQNVYVNFHSGASSIYISNFQLANSKNTLFNGYIHWNKHLDFINAVGITYETKPFVFNQKKYYLTTSTQLSYIKHLNIYNVFQVQNDTYLPLRIKKKRLRLNIGLRNTIILYNFGNDDIIQNSKLNLYRIGVSFLIGWNISKNSRINLVINNDLSPFVKNYTGSSFKIIQANLSFEHILW